MFTTQYFRFNLESYITYNLEIPLHRRRNNTNISAPAGFAPTGGDYMMLKDSKSNFPPACSCLFSFILHFRSQITFIFNIPERIFFSLLSGSVFIFSMYIPQKTLMMGSWCSSTMSLINDFLITLRDAEQCLSLCQRPHYYIILRSPSSINRFYPRSFI